VTATTSLVTGVDFVGVPTRDLEAATRFYGTVLGLPRSAHKDGLFAEFETGNLTLSVFNPGAMGLEHHEQKNSIALHVDDVEAARATARGARRVVRAGHAGHGRLPHGLLRRPRRQRAHAPPPLRPPPSRELTSAAVKAAALPVAMGPTRA
jgi:catechol 2,3-dioxygenase-like lactoylglutathione lyase family enzyme